MKYYNVFTPGAPPHVKELLVGRQADLDNLRTYLKSPGIHPIVVGPRGIGKTSLVQQILDEYKCKSQIEANTVSDFDELARCICEDLHIEAHKVITLVHEEEETKEAKGKIVVAEGGLSHKNKSVEQMSGLSGKSISPQVLKRLLMKSDRDAVISIDELDDLNKKSDIPEKLAKFAKSCSNQAKWMKQKFVFSGIGRDAHSLFGAHLSSQRNHPVIYLAALTKGDFNSFFDSAQRKLHMEIPLRIRDDIISDADGFPYYMHQVCFHMFDCFDKDKKSRVLKNEHLSEGKKRAFDEAFAHYLRKYKFTVYKLNDVQKEILRQMVIMRKRHCSYFELEETIQADFHYSKEDAKKAFRFLKDHKYIDYRKSDNTVSLHDALLKPFLRIKLKHKKEDKEFLPLFHIKSEN